MGNAAAYLRNVSATVRQSDGWAVYGEGIVVHDPGRFPDEGLMAGKSDIVDVFEGRYDDMASAEALAGQLKMEREDYATLVHSVPKELGSSGLRSTIEHVRRDVEWLYLTDLTENMWSGYASFWEEWLDVAW